MRLLPSARRKQSSRSAFRLPDSKKQVTQTTCIGRRRRPLADNARLVSRDAGGKMD